MTCRDCKTYNFCPDRSREYPCVCFKKKGEGNDKSNDKSNDNRKAEKVQRVKVRA